LEAVRNFNVREFILGTAITTSLFLVVVLSPVIGFVFCLLAPLPIALFTWRMGRVPGITMLLLSIGLLAAVFKIGGFVESLPFFLVLGSAGILIPEVLRRVQGIEAAVGLSVVAYLALIGAALLGYSLAVDRSVADIVRSYVDESVRYSLALYEEIGLPREQIEQLKESAPEVAAWVVHHGPALLVTGVTFFVWLNVLGLRLLSQGRDPAFPDFGDLACWKMPDWVVWFVIAAGAAMIVPEEAGRHRATGSSSRSSASSTASSGWTPSASSAGTSTPTRCWPSAPCRCCSCTCSRGCRSSSFFSGRRTSRGISGPCFMR